MNAKNYSLALLFFVFLFWGCDTHRNKSIFETLSEKDITDKMQKDSVFLEIYESLNAARPKFNNFSITEKAKYKNLKYSNFCDIKEFINNSSDYSKYSQQWIKEFGDDERKLDSVSTYYRNIRRGIREADGRTAFGYNVGFLKKYGRYPNSEEELMDSFTPKALLDYWRYPWLQSSAIKELVNENYLNKSEYILSIKFPLEYEFLKSVKLI